MTIAVVMIHYGDQEVTRHAVGQLVKQGVGIKLVLVNNTQDKLQHVVSGISHAHIINLSHNLGFARAVNQGITYALQDPQVEYILLLNNDAYFSFGSPQQLTRTFIHKKSAGIVTPVLHHGDNMYDWGGTLNKWTGLISHLNFHEKPKTVLSVSHAAAAAMMIKRDVIERVGMFDERFFMYFEDVDYCLRVAQWGYTIHINPDIVVDHQVSAGSFGFARMRAVWGSHLQFIIKYMPALVYPTALISDILYYPALTLWATIKSLR